MRLWVALMRHPAYLRLSIASSRTGSSSAMIEVYGRAFLTYTVFDEGVGEEVERLEVVPCRRCAASRSPHPDGLCSNHQRGRRQERADN
jgi:hypothetical protein